MKCENGLFEWQSIVSECLVNCRRSYNTSIILQKSKIVKGANRTT